jgi:Do/DeqQ family serine protease
MGSGSGVIFSKDGYIVTNNHVIEGASNIKIVMHDKTEYTAKLVGADPNTDLAVLKIEKNDLPAIILGNSDNIAVGEWVLAIGNPFDLSSTVTAGIVSAKSRNIRILENEDGFSVESFIQTDAAVNPGNSGGALINLNGELVGINTAIATQTGGFSGYSFAVPINLAQKIMRDIIEFGTVQRAILGVRIKDLTPEIVQSAGLTSFSGVFVVYVGGESSAKDAGIQEGDVIVAINDTAVNSTAQLQEFVARKRPGDKIKLSYYRNKMLKHANATLKNRMEGNDMAVKGGALHFPILGAYISELKIEEKNVLGIQNGVKVSRISKGKLMDAGMPEGFVITHVDKQGVSSVEDFETALHGKKGGVLFEGLSKDGNKLYFAIGL